MLITPGSLYSLCLSSMNNLLNNTLSDFIRLLDSVDSVVNLSDFSLEPHHVSLLKRGLTFCPTPGEPDMADLKRDLDAFHRNVKLLSHFGKKIEKADAWSSQLSQKHKIETCTESDGNSNTDQPSRAILGPFGHYQFKNKSTWVPENTPMMIDCLISVDELCLAKTKIKAPLKQNLTKKERLGIKELAMNRDIVIKKADKGSCVVIMNTTDYLEEGYSQLSNEKFYRKVDYDLTNEHNEKVGSIVRSMFHKNEISLETAEFLVHEQPRTAQFYLLPKIHKRLNKPPGRPIVSANECPTERISQFVDFFLKPLIPKIKSYLRDTSHFILEIFDLGKVPRDSILVTADVCSLYTNIVIREAILCVLRFLTEFRRTSQMPTNISLVELLEAVLTLNNFQFNDENFLQVGGTAMGTKVAPSLANVFMADFEEKFIYSYDKQPIFYKRFLDDLILIWTHGKEELDKFFEHLNKCHETIKFTMESSSDQINFLDTTLHKDADGTLWTDLYCKPTDSHTYLHYKSAHPHIAKEVYPIARC